jgi:hypothetical protein
MDKTYSQKYLMGMPEWKYGSHLLLQGKEMLNISFTQYVSNVNIKGGNKCPKTEFLYLSTGLISGQG